MSPTVRLSGFALALLLLSLTVLSGGPPSQAVLPEAKFVARDPGVRTGPPGAGGMISGLTAREQQFSVQGSRISSKLNLFKAQFQTRGLVLGHGLTWMLVQVVMCNPRWEERVQL
jgi:hypothetical protein